MWRQGAKFLQEVQFLSHGVVERLTGSVSRGGWNPSQISSSSTCCGSGTLGSSARAGGSRGKHCVALWGNGDHGRLGLSSSSSSTESRWEPTLCESLSSVPVTVACGGAHTLVLTNEGRVFSAGLNDHGQVGVEPSLAQRSPFFSTFVEVAHGLPARCVHIAAGYRHSAAISDEGQVYVWGCNGHGQLGLGRKAKRNVTIPTHVHALQGLRIRKLSLGAEHSLAISEDGEALSWGNGQDGRLGHGQSSGVLRFFRNTSEFLPRLIESLRGIRIRDISAGLMHSACVDSFGMVYTFGSGRMSQLGLGSGSSSSREQPEPIPLPGLPAVRGVACGGYHTGAVTNSGDLYMWGSNVNGCLGFGYQHTDQAPNPMKIDGPLLRENVVDVSCGWKHSCALTDDGKVFAWGWGGSAGTYAADGQSGGGQLGLGNEFDYNEPTLVLTPNTMKGVHISCGFNHTAAILKDR